MEEEWKHKSVRQEHLGTKEQQVVAALMREEVKVQLDLRTANGYGIIYVNGERRTVMIPQDVDSVFYCSMIHHRYECGNAIVYEFQMDVPLEPKELCVDDYHTVESCISVHKNEIKEVKKESTAVQKVVIVMCGAIALMAAKILYDSDTPAGEYMRDIVRDISGDEPGKPNPYWLYSSNHSQNSH